MTNGSALADVERPDGGLALSRTDLEIDEGESGTYTVALASQPASDVTVEISQRPPGRATVSPASLTFTADNWNTPQTVTITSAEDANYLDRWLLLRHVATGDNYGASAVAWLLLRDGYNLVTATPNTGATGSPTISGTPQVDHTLTVDTSDIADADGLTHASYTYLYQWIRNNARRLRVRRTPRTPWASQTQARPSRSRSPSPTMRTTRRAAPARRRWPLSHHRTSSQPGPPPSMGRPRCAGL